MEKPKLLVVVGLMALLATVLVATPVAATGTDGVDADDLEQFWADEYESVIAELSGLTPDPVGDLVPITRAKAAPDECYYGLGDPRNGGTPPCPPGAVPKVDQAYVWGLTSTSVSHDLWFGTAPNVHCLVLGGFLGVEIPHETDSWACEFGSSRFSPPLPGIVGDWRPPQIFSYNTLSGSVVDRTPVTDPRLATSLGMRSAGSFGRIVFLGGPDLLGGITLFAFDAMTSQYLGSKNFPEYDNIRKWIVARNGLYTAVGSTDGGGRVLRWVGTRTDPFRFAEVGFIGSEGAELAYHQGRLYVTTWPSLLDPQNPVGSPVPAGLWMSPPLPVQGLQPKDAGGWRNVWSFAQYEPDPVTAITYGGGAIVSMRDGSLIWGSMHVPFLAAVAHLTVYGPAEPGLDDIVTAMLGTHRAVTIFRGTDLGTPAAKVEVLYGNRFLPGYDPVAGWQFLPNRMAATPLFGLAGFNNIFNNYTWTGVEYDGDAFFGTMDWSYLFRGMVQVLGELLGVEIPDLDLDLPKQFYGADLWRFPENGGPATPEFLAGVTNYGNYGIRTMLADSRGIFLGMANPMNLLTDPTDDKPEGGWELIQLAGRLRRR